MLYLVATPIGNLKDISQRALDTLQACEYILCEDTRHTLPLLTHYAIQKSLKSFHKFNESQKEDVIIADLLAGKELALVSDAGTPGISDPGTKLVQRCRTEGIAVTAIPGPCAAIMALSISGFDTVRFQFIGFLPRKAGELRHMLQNVLQYPSTTVCYESPHRLLAVLEALHELVPTRQVAVGRELTKKFEEVSRGTSEELLNQWKDKEIKGEIVLLIAGDEQRSSHQWETLTPEEHVAFLESTYRLSQYDAIKMAAEMRGVPKRTVYAKIHKR